MKQSVAWPPTVDKAAPTATPGGGGRNGTTRLTGRPQIARAAGGPRTFVRATAQPPADARSEAGTHALGKSLGRHRPAIRSRNGTLKVYHRN